MHSPIYLLKLPLHREASSLEKYLSICTTLEKQAMFLGTPIQGISIQSSALLFPFLPLQFTTSVPWSPAIAYCNVTNIQTGQNYASGIQESLGPLLYEVAERREQSLDLSLRG